MTEHNDSPTTVKPLIPMAVKELTLKRSPYPRDGGRFTVTAEGVGWSGTFLAKPEDVFTRLQEVAAIMEAQK